MSEIPKHGWVGAPRPRRHTPSKPELSTPPPRCLSWFTYWPLVKELYKTLRLFLIPAQYVTIVKVFVIASVFLGLFTAVASAMACVNKSVKWSIWSTVAVTLQGMWKKNKKWNLLGPIYRYIGRSQTSYTAPCNGVISRLWGSNWGSSYLLHTHKHKTNTLTILVRRATFYTHLSLHSDGSRCRWIHIILVKKKKKRKTRRPPIWAPMAGWNSAGSGISLVYLWPYFLSVRIIFSFN